MAATVTALVPAGQEKPDRLTVYVPPALKHGIRIAAACDGITMTEWVGRVLDGALPAFALSAAQHQAG